MELFKDVKGYEELYQVSNLGRVKSLPKIVGRRLRGETVLAQQRSRHGYYMVDLCTNGKRFNASVHRLVAEAFIPNPDNKPCVNHIDGDKANNCVDNLEWCTHSENQLHAYKNNLCPRHKKPFKRKPLTDEQKAKISEATKNAMSRPEVQKKLHRKRKVVE